MDYQYKVEIGGVAIVTGIVPMFGIWNIQYKDEADSTVIKFSAQTLQPAGNDLHYLCSFTAIGELVHKES